jgi:hypothetical protein
MATSKSAANGGNESIVDSDVASAYLAASNSEVLKLIQNSTYGGDLIDVREQVERLQTNPQIIEKVIEASREIEEKRAQRRSEAAINKTEVDLSGLAMPYFPLSLKSLFKDPKHGTAYVALASVLGEDAPIYHFLKKEGSETVIGLPWRVMAGEVDGSAAPIVVDQARSEINGVEFIGHQIGNGAHAYARIGPVVLNLPISVSEDFRRERVDRNFDRSKFDFDLAVGAPPLKMPSSILPGIEIDSMDTAPMSFIHPRDGEKVPHKTPLKIEAILGIKTRYDGVRVVVSDSDGNAYFGVLAVEGIRRACGEKVKTEKGGTVYALTDASIGKRFQIESASLRRNKKGLLINIENQTEPEFLKANPGSEFVECWDVVVSNPDDAFDLDL